MLFFIKDLSLSFPHKICFSSFSTYVHFGSRIAIIGRNGSGKSSLLKMIFEMKIRKSIGYIPQIIENYDSYSGGERFNRALSVTLATNPDLLLLDEPTNHLDKDNRRGLFKKLDAYNGTLIIVTHDREILHHYVDILWHINNNQITVFHGKYDDYIREQHIRHQSLQNQLKSLQKEKQNIHENLMKEQEKIAKSKASGKKKVQNKRWMKSVGDLKAMNAESSQGGKLKKIAHKKNGLLEKLEQMRLPEIIFPKFHISAPKNHKGILLSIYNGSIGYKDKTIWSDINISLHSAERLAIVGKNGCGKTTLIKAILNDSNIIKTGNWSIPQNSDIGILNQHYNDLDGENTPIEVIRAAAINWSYTEIRKHLNDFLFRKNEEVETKVEHLSGGEKAKLSLARIAANSPKLLILDEITNNLDTETYDHVIQVLKNYPGAMLVVSHDEDFLKAINIESFLQKGG